MFLHTAPTDISMLISDLAQFLVNAGYSKVAEDQVQMSFHNTTNVSGTMPGTGQVLLPVGHLGGNAYMNFQVSRLVVKDPAASCHVHMLFFTHGVANTLDGVANVVPWFCDMYMSTGWSGADHIDDHPGLCKLTTVVYLLDEAMGLDLFSTTGSEGKLCVHAAVEQKPQVYVHFGFGCLEKLLDFTGGDYVTAPTNFTAYDSYYKRFTGAYASRGNDGGSNLITPQSGFYCPDLDAPNKRDQNNLYRFFSGDNGGTPPTRTNMEGGRSSMSIAMGNTGIYAPAPMMGGDLSPALLPLPNPWSGGSPLLPITIFSQDGNNRNYSSPVGYFGNVRGVNIKNFNPRDEIELGPDTWAVYPVRAKDGLMSSTNYSTGDQGYAVRKVV
jgi:hypothetical protein